MSQRDKVADHLRTWGGINDDSAWRLYRVQQLRTRVCELRQQGWVIDTDDAVPGHYVLVQEPGQQPLQQELPL